jgi:hypothetical protein
MVFKRFKCTKYNNIEQHQFIREEVWRRFSLFISSPEYQLFWTTFFNMAGVKCCLEDHHSPFKPNHRLIINNRCMASYL